MMIDRATISVGRRPEDGLPRPSRSFLDGPRRQSSVTGAALLLAALCGCHGTVQEATETQSPPEVEVVHPARGPLRWTVRQPGYIEAFEETPIFPKIMGYVEKWHVDIGDRVRQGDILAELWVPDLVGELREKEAEVEQTKKALDVAQAQVVAAATSVDEAKAGIQRAQAELAFSQTQFKRISKLEDSVIEKQVKSETFSQMQGREATIAECQAKIAHA